MKMLDIVRGRNRFLLVGEEEQIVSRSVADIRALLAHGQPPNVTHIGIPTTRGTAAVVIVRPV